ncbi:uncharacterized protein EI90DRAFT_3093504 [Cantharellus anzutake]|uniref:uncharacterized protein n=1 Tax=Cantharellus anzutake TaxID=1750568 RepID=UPI00190803B1|nr:uncharacterized protein EI90DRAFT_3093504 [Cantharellus anzutake]KAF8312552.1 hypothetical protein EI90DRAFT_3093504 [Cantharellus anzutake]
MLRFPSDDFDDPRWPSSRTLSLSRVNSGMVSPIIARRTQCTAACFLLGRRLQNAMALCIKQFQDSQLAVIFALY